jgi:putative FmdB family regulatory protein
MPIYEYACADCGQVVEAIQKFSDRPLTKCKFCSGKLHKLVSQSSFHLKGSGWYVTDYSRKSKSPSPTAQKESGSTPAQAKPSPGGSTASGSSENT